MAQDRPLHIGILLPIRGILFREGPPDPTPLLEMAEMAEEAGCHSVWAGDSLTSKPRLEALTTLAVAAGRTQRVRLGTAILLAGMRHPLHLARTVATLDILSGGRVLLGVGVGGAFTTELQKEWRDAGVLPQERAGRLEEVLLLLRRLWTEEQVTFQGRFFTLEGVSLEPRPLQKPGVPILVACHSRTRREAHYRRAALLGDGVISITDTPEEYARVLERVRAYAREAGKDPSSLLTAFYMTVNLNADEGEAHREAESFLLRYYGANIWGDRWGPFGRPERVVERVQAYHRAGAEIVILRFASYDPPAQLRLFIREVLPTLRG